ncbi:heavy metal translocating P-type ATPase [Leeuwenhoekiella marinoflava]|uniref:Heavy-metal-associated domain-containing protein n=2 Tax=Leeuwenhoekiella marinoflava TaxID=988 RepID=A0A4Q0PLY1_9FLAO|nr:heavy metal-associated domain-containing protein [Leeuwenhoekiella marinoflava]RXG30730.1 heavy-metal-associated domain-containing protein [Leeuwenhoekiella marinoflava]SHF18352.1 Heavy-metal-associated domain-containing protein [Leeuwenhoekiella marinoflava DSM 3653]
MTHTYSVTGMTCNGCRTGVEQKLNAVAGVEQAEVNLEREEAVITMNSHIATEAFQKALPAKYTITQQQESHPSQPQNVFSSAEQERSKLAQLKPLFLIFAFISVAAVLLHKEDWNWREMMLDFMGLFYIVFSFFKLLDLKGFPQSFSMYDPLAKALPVYGTIYPFIELALGLCFLMRFQLSVALVITLVILGITTLGVTRALLDKKAIPCACLGTALKLPMTEATFIENAIMIVMAMLMLLV